MANAELGRTFVAGRSRGRRRQRRRGQPGVLGAGARLPIRPSSARRFSSTRCPFNVVGVMPRGFEFPTATNVEVWMPLAFNPKDLHGAVATRPFADGRRRAWPRRVDAVQAQDEVAVLANRIAAAYKDSNAGWGARVVAAHEQLVAASRPALMMLMGAVGFLLLIVCANMANLLLARLSSRRREIAVRGALGAGRMDVARPILAESLLLSLGGGARDCSSPPGGLRIMAALPEAGLPRMDRIAPRRRRAAVRDGGVGGRGDGVRRAAGAPRRQNRPPLASIDEGSGGATSSPYARRVLSGLVVVEVALALVLLVGAGLMTRSFTKLLQVSPGFDGTNLVAARVLLPTAKYSQRPDAGALLRGRHRSPATRARRTAAPRRCRRCRFRTSAPPCALPFTRRRTAAAAHRGSAGRRPHRRAGLLRDDEDPSARGPLPRRARRRRTAPRTSVINETMARRYFPDRSPLGQIDPEPARQERSGRGRRRCAQSGARRVSRRSRSTCRCGKARRPGWRWSRAPSATRCRLPAPSSG